MTRLTLALWPFVVGCLLIIGLNRAEERWFPVVDDFQVTTMAHTGDMLELSGVMRKIRNCQFVGVSAEGISQDDLTELKLAFVDRKDNVSNATRPPGTQDWGPWHVYLPVKPEMQKLTLIAAHRCHPAWMTETKLITIDLEK